MSLGFGMAKQSYTYTVWRGSAWQCIVPVNPMANKADYRTRGVRSRLRIAAAYMLGDCVGR